MSNMLKNIQDLQDADLLVHNKTMGSIKELYRSDIENKTLYEQYLKYRDKLLELSTSLLTYYDELINL
jgi:hypothetical protein